MSDPATVRAFIGLGSNLEDPVRQVLTALEALTALPRSRLVRRSSLYETPPMGPPGQPHYINAVAELATTLSPHALLAELQALEAAHRRVRGERWGPRTLDLDLLVYGSAMLDEPRLVVPHPGIASRAFVLMPLAEIAPSLVIPRLPTPAEMLSGVDVSGIRRR